MDDEDPAAGLADGADKIAHKVVALGLVDADAVLDRHRHVHHVDHGLDAIGHQLGLGHQTGTKGAALYTLTGAATVEVDLVIAPLDRQACTVRQVRRIAAAQLQGHGMLLRVEPQMARHVPMDQCTGGHHLGVEQGLAADQTMEVAAMPISPVEHRRDT